MTRIRKVLLSAGLLAIGFVTLSAFGGHHWGHGEVTPEKANRFATFMLDNALDDVKATEQQRAQMQALKDRRLPDVLALMKESKSVHAELLKEWSSDKPNAKAIHAAIDQRIDEMRALAHKLADDALEAHDILTPEQRSEITERFQSRMQHE